MDRILGLAISVILIVGFTALPSLRSTALEVITAPTTTPATGLVVSPIDVDELDPHTFLAQVEPQPTLTAPVPYNRDDYQPNGWADTDSDCQSDRHEVLIRSSLVPVTLSGDGCRVESGRWIDWLDGTVYTQAAQVEIDHLVALSAAHQAGAWEWDDSTKRHFANDLDFVGSLSPTGSATNQAKSDRRPDQWQPPRHESWCSYAGDWIRVKARWGLAFSATEVAALNNMLDTCPPQS